MATSLKRIMLVPALATLIAVGIIGLAVEISSSSSATRSALCKDAAAQASLAASLIHTALTTHVAGAGGVPPTGRGAGDGGVPPTAHGGSGAAVRAAAASGPVVPRGLVAQQLTDLARYGRDAEETSVFVVDSAGSVVAAASGGRAGPAGQVSALRAALNAHEREGFEPGGTHFFAIAPVAGEPWRVVYMVPSTALDGTIGTGIPTMMLLMFGAAAIVCLLLLVRLQSSSTKLARANEALALRNETVERATEAKTRFVASMSHELRTPLNAVIGFAELMHDGRTGPVSKRQREFLGIIRASANHLLSLINEVLDLSKIEAGQIRLEPEAVEPAAIASECVDSLRWLAAEKRVAIDFDATPLGAASLDPARLRQVILNYLSNAVKFTGSGGRVRVGLAHEGDQLLIEVSDTGIGIADEDQPRVFEEFVQVANTNHGGSGLGLAVTKQIVEAQGGEVGVVSQVGRGSSFYARLPWVDADPSETATAPGRARAREATPLGGEFPLTPPGSRFRRARPATPPGDLVGALERSAEPIGARGR